MQDENVEGQPNNDPRPGTFPQTYKPGLDFKLARSDLVQCDPKRFFTANVPMCDSGLMGTNAQGQTIKLDVYYPMAGSPFAMLSR